MNASKVKSASIDFLSLSVKNHSSGKVQDSFQTYMDKTAGQKSSAAKESQSISTKQDGKKLQNIAEKTDNSSNPIKEKENDGEKILKENNAITNSSENAVKKSKEGLSEKELEAIGSQLVALIQQIVTGTLEITEEELGTALESLGLTELDMLDPANQKQLLLLLNDVTDISSILTDENLLNSVMELEENLDFDTLLSELDSTEKMDEKDLKLLLNNLKKPVDEILEEDSKAVETNQKAEAPVIEIVKEGSYGGAAHTGSNDSKEFHDRGEKVTSNQEGMALNQILFDTSNTLAPDELEALTNVKEIVNQIVEQIKIHIKPDTASIELQLNPENLGKVQVSVVEKNGVLTAEFKAANQVVKEVLESQIHVFKENLNNQGLKVEAVEVTVSNFDFNQNGGAATTEENNQNSKRPFYFQQTQDVRGKESDNVVQSMMELEGNSINYTA